MAYTGSGTSLQIGKESAWGTSVAGVKNANMTSESIKLTADKKTEDTLVASKNSTARLLMGLTVGGDFSGILKPEFAGYLLYLVLGGTDTVVTGTPVTGANTHTMVAAAANGILPAFTTIVDRRAAVKKYSGCKIDSFTLEGAVADFVKYTASIKAKDEATGTLAVLSANALASFKSIAATLAIGGTSYPVKKVTLKHSNNLADTGQTYGSGLYVTEPVLSTRADQVDIELLHSADVDTISTTYGQTDTNVAIVWHIESPSMVTGTTPYGITITLPNVSLDVPDANVGGKDLISAKLTGYAQSVSSTEAVSVVVVDATATAYSA